MANPSPTPRRQRLSRRPRPALHVERLEDRFLMDGAGFAHTDPDEDPGSVVGVAGILAINDFVTAPHDASQVLIGVLANDPLPAGSTRLRIKSVSATFRGATVALSEDGQRILYTPPEGGVAHDTFYYIVEDEHGNRGKANVTIGMNGTTRWPDTGNDWFRVLEDSDETNFDVLANDGSFASGEIIAVTEPSGEGSVRIADDGKSLFYRTAPASNGSDSFRYTIRRADGETAEVSVYVDVEKPFHVNYDHFPFNVDSGPVVLDPLANDHRLGPTPEAPRITSVSQPPQGTLAITDEGQRLIFTPAAGYIGSFTFNYTVQYGTAEHQRTFGSAYVRVENTFLAVDDWIGVEPDSAQQRLDVLRNDPILDRYDLRDVTLRIVAATAGSHGGAIAIDPADGAILYTPAAGFVGAETFSYTVEDSTGHRDSATVTVHVAERPLTALPRFTVPGELEQYLIDQAVARYKWQFGVVSPRYSPTEIDFSNFFTTSAATNKDSTRATGYSETNTQEAGVDEADIVETDGRYLYTFSRGKLAIVDLGDPTNPQLVSLTQLGDQFDEMYLQGSRLTLITRGWQWSSSKAVVATFDISDPGDPEILERTEINGFIVDSRAVGDRVHVAVMGLTLPEIQSLQLPSANPEDPVTSQRYEALDEYVDRVRATLIESSLPSYRTYDADGELVRQGLVASPADIHKPIDAADNSLLALVMFDVADGAPGPDASAGIFTSAGTQVYMSGGSFYVLRNYDGDTGIFKFTLDDDGAPTLAAVGKVEGWLLNQFSVDEHDGRLRIATTGTVWEEFDGWRRELRRSNNLFVLEQVGAELVVVGAVENLAPTETIKSVRYLDDRAYVVTFRVVDPLFAVDLSDPTHPTVEGALKIPGYSDYLHPVGENYVIGIGRDADEITGRLGLPQISLFYVGDLAHPTLVDQVTMEGAEWAFSEAWNDHHAVAYFAESQVLTIPVSWSETVNIDDDGDGFPDRQEWHPHSAVWAFGIEVDQAGGGAIEIAGQIQHDGEARRSVRIGDALITVSGDTIKVHDIEDLSHQLGELHIGPLPVDDSLTVLEDSGPTTIDVRDNDRPGIDGDAPRIVSVTQPKAGYWLWWNPLDDGEPSGTVEIAANGESLIFTPAANFYGTVVFTYTVRDEVHGDETATVTITVENVPDDPQAVADEFRVEPDSGVTVLDVLANDVKPDSRQPSVLHLVVDPINLRLATPLVVTADFVITDRVIDSIDFAPGLGITPWRYTLPMKIVAVSAGIHGGSIAIAEGAGAVAYQPAPGFVGAETFTYTIETADGRTAVGTVTVHVGNAAPETQPVAPVLAPNPDAETPPSRPAYRPPIELPTRTLSNLRAGGERAGRTSSRSDFRPATPSGQHFDSPPVGQLEARDSMATSLADHDQAVAEVAEFDARFEFALASLVGADL